MPSVSDIVQFMRGQILETPVFPPTTTTTTVDLTGKCMVVTGANTGLGLECAKHLINLNLSTLIIACRNVEKGEAARTKILESVSTGAGSRKGSKQALIPVVEVWEVDLDNYKSVLSFADRVQKHLPRLDGFVANAGVSLKDFSMSEDCERTLTVNVVSTFLLATLMLPKLRQTAVTYGCSTNLTVVSSSIHAFAKDEQLQRIPEDRSVFDALSDPQTADMSARYFLSKLIVQLCLRGLAEQVSKSMDTDIQHRVVVNSVNPGWCRTELFRYDDGGSGGRIGLRLIGRTAEAGARTLAHAVTAGTDSHGKYLSECRVKPESDYVRSVDGQKMQMRLWKELSMKIEGLSPGALTFG